MGKAIIVIDIKITNYSSQNEKIIDIGIVKLDLNSGKITPAYKSLMREPLADYSHFQSKNESKKSDMSSDQLMNCPSLEDQRPIIQYLLDLYEATAYNKGSLFRFLKDRGFKIKELPCPMLLATRITNSESDLHSGTPQWQTLESVWRYFVGENDYIESYKAIDQASYVAQIVYELYKLNKFSVSHTHISAKFHHYFRTDGGKIIFVYSIEGSLDEITIFKKAQGTSYRETKNGTPLFYSQKALSRNRNQLVQLIITDDCQIIPDDFARIIENKQKLEDYYTIEKEKLSVDSNSLKWETERKLIEKDTPEILNTICFEQSQSDTEMLEQNMRNQNKDNTTTWQSWLGCAIPFSIIMGLVTGALNLISGDSFVDGFLESTGWIVGLLFIVGTLIFMAIMGGLFGGNDSNKY